MSARRWAVFTVGFALGCLAGCLSGEDDLNKVREDEAPPPEEVVVSSGEEDSGVLPPPPPDAGRDAGADAGRDAGVADAGYDAGRVSLPSAAGWQFFGPQHGGPRRAFGAAQDEGGNLWVAGGGDGLFLLTPGASGFRRFTHVDGLASYTDFSGVNGNQVISVAGGPPGTAFVGYKGVHGGADELDPEYMVRSGDADKVVLLGAGISVSHFDLRTPPGVSSTYPQGRDKIRDVFRILYDPSNGDVWFGGNHGIAMFKGSSKAIHEHHHAAVNGYLPSGSYTLLSGDWYGLAMDPAGDLWMGGGHRLARLKYASEGKSWYADMDPVIDVWPDAVASGGRPEERTDDFVQDLAVSPDGTVWVASIPNSLAQVADGGVAHLTSGLIDRKITALETDPKDGSVWVGHIWGGITRFKGGSTLTYDYRLFGFDVANAEVLDIQSVRSAGGRRMVVAFGNGAIGVYSGD